MPKLPDHKFYPVKYLFALALAISFAGYFLFHHAISKGIYDLAVHIEMAKFYANQGTLAPNFLYYALITILYHIFGDYIIGAAILLGLSLGLKYLATSLILSEILSASSTISKLIVIVAPLIFLLSNHILTVVDPEKCMYIGKIPINVWHNSTTIFLMPFAVLLFYYALRFLKTDQLKYLFPVLLLSVLNIYIKPSFVYVFVVAFPILYVMVYGFKSDNLPWFVITFGILGLIILKQYAEISNDKVAEVFYGQEKTTVVVRPFMVWRYYSTVVSNSSILIDLVASFAFPFLVSIFYFRKMHREPGYQLAILLLLVSMGILILFAETGNRAYHGNFFWQAYVCNFIFFVICFKNWITVLLQRNSFKYYDYILSALLILHLLSGSYYLHRFIVHVDYM